MSWKSTPKSSFCFQGFHSSDEFMFRYFCFIFVTSGYYDYISDRLLVSVAYQCLGFLMVPAGSSGLGSPLGRSRHSSSQSDLTTPSSSSSGLSFTACMSDFSLYVFHPYGAGKQKTAVSGLTPASGGLGTLNMSASLQISLFDLFRKHDTFNIGLKSKIRNLMSVLPYK